VDEINKDFSFRQKFGISAQRMIHRIMQKAPGPAFLKFRSNSMASSDQSLSKIYSLRSVFPAEIRHE
jgi:hypothetical protein